MNPLLSLLSRYTTPRTGNSFVRAPRLGVPGDRTRSRTRLSLEPLEDRTVPSTLSVADVTVREGPASLGAIDPAGAAALGLADPRNIVFDNIPGSAHYGDLFVTSNTPNGNGGEQPPGKVLRFDMASQTYQPFVSPGSGGFQSAAGITFGPDGNLYVSSSLQSEILEYDGATGNFLGVYVSAGAGGLNNPLGNQIRARRGSVRLQQRLQPDPQVRGARQSGRRTARPVPGSLRQHAAHLPVQFRLRSGPERLRQLS